MSIYSENIQRLEKMIAAAITGSPPPPEAPETAAGVLEQVVREAFAVPRTTADQDAGARAGAAAGVDESAGDRLAAAAAARARLRAADRLEAAADSLRKAADALRARTDDRRTLRGIDMHSGVMASETNQSEPQQYLSVYGAALKTETPVRLLKRMIESRHFEPAAVGPYGYMISADQLAELVEIAALLEPLRRKPGAFEKA